MKAIFLSLAVIFTALFFEPVTNVSYAQNCVCAECNYPCKTPMVHASNCKYNNGRTSESVPEINSENKSFSKSEETEIIDVEYQLLLIHSKVRSVSADTSPDIASKEKVLLEQKVQLEKFVPENEPQKMLYEKISEDLQSALKALEK